MKPILTLCFLFACFLVNAQEKDTAIKSTDLEEVVFSANKFQEKKKFISQRIEIISSKQIANVNAQNTGDLLLNTGNVFVQKSQLGGSSPVIRGFEASRVLLVVDGVRMNNAIYRAGHLQNVITVDQNSLERVELMYGPSSTMYGSDALGGTIHMITKPVRMQGNNSSAVIGGNALLRYATINDEKTGHFDFNYGGKKWGFLTSVTYSDFGDLKMGGEFSSDYPNFGKRDSFVLVMPGRDSVVGNSNNLLQRYSGYKQWDVLQKVVFQPSDGISHQLNLQLSNSTDVPRYDRLQDKRNGTLRYAEWYYGPQQRTLVGYTFTASKLSGIIDALRATVSYQDIEESRQQRDLNRLDRFDSRRENVKVWGLVVDTRKVVGRNEFTVGFDAQLNDVKSVADRTNLLTGEKTRLDSRYPDGKNWMNHFGLFAQHLYKFASEKLILNDGIRIQNSSLGSNIIDNSFFNLPVTSINQNNTAVTGNIGLVYLPTEKTRVNIGIATGFRAPNIDDLTKIFESAVSKNGNGEVTSAKVVVPNADIEPEYTYTFDLGWKQQVGSYVSFELNGFYTAFRNAIVVAPFTLNGKDSIFYNGVKSQVLASQNRNKANLFGGYASVTVKIMRNLVLTSSINYTEGKYQVEDGEKTTVYEKQPDGTYKLVTRTDLSTRPLDHIPPIFGRTGLRYEGNRWDADLYALYNGWKHLEDYNTDGEDNAQYATADGSPSWYTLNLKASVALTSNFRVQAGVENILDRNYRYFASGLSAPGRNFIVSLRAGF